MLKISKEELENLLEKAYLNGIAAAGIARETTGYISNAEDFKKSTAYREFICLSKQYMVINND